MFNWIDWGVIGFEVDKFKVVLVVVLVDIVWGLVVRERILIICGIEVFWVLELSELCGVGVIESIWVGSDIGIIGFWKLGILFVEDLGLFIFVFCVDFSELMIFFKDCFGCIELGWIGFIDFDCVSVREVGDFSVLVFLCGVCLKLYLFRREFRE